ncbi:MAG: GumC family protein [Erythrobacter sp.]
MNEPSPAPKSAGSMGRELWTDAYLPVEYAPRESRPQPVFDTGWLRGALFRQRWLIGGTLAAALLLGFVATLLMTPIYKATASVRVSPWGNMIVEGQELQTPLMSASEIDNFLSTQVEVVESRSMAEIVAAALEPSTIATLLGAEIDRERPAGADDEEWAREKARLAGEVLHAGISADIPTAAMILTISYNSDDPVLAAQIVNQYLEAFAQADTRRNLDSNAYAREYLLEQIDLVRQRLREAERSANIYARNAGIIAQSAGEEGEGGATVTTSNLARINETAADARARRISAEQKWQAVRDLDPLRVPEVQASAAVQSLLGERAKLNGELSVLRQRYDDQYPVIADIKSRIALLDEEIDRAARDIKDAIRSEYDIARRQEAALRAELNAVTEDALVEQDETIRYDELQREASSLRLQLNALLERYNSLTTAANVQSGSITPLDRATVPTEAVSPSMFRNMLIALVLGAGFAGGLALVREIFVDQLRRPEDVEERLGLTLLGMTPHVRNEELENQGSDNFSSLMESYSSIRSALDYTIGRDGAVVQLTSSQPSEGKSTTSLILAELFARMGRKTLLIEADLRRPSIHSLIGIGRPEIGLTEVLLGRASFDDAKVDHVHTNLTILPVGQVPPDPVVLLSSGHMQGLIENVRNEYSVVIIDTSPVLGLADAPEIARLVDLTVFVVEANRTSLGQARSAVGRLQKVGARIAGAVLTKYKPLEAGVDYSYKEYYRYGRDG